MSMLFTITIEEDQEIKDLGMVPINKTWEFEAETLNEVLQGVSDMLRGAGFTYVNEVVAIKDNGTETSSEDVSSGYDINVTIEDFLKDLHNDNKKPNLRVVENGQEETKS